MVLCVVKLSGGRIALSKSAGWRRVGSSCAMRRSRPTIREGSNSDVLETWIHRGVYASDTLRAMASRMLDNFRVGPGMRTIIGRV